MFQVAAIGRQPTLPVAGPPDVVATFINNYQSGVDGASFTFAISTSTATAGRRLFFDIVNRLGSGSFPSTVKVHVPDVATDPTGISATLRASISTGSNRISHWIVAVPTGAAAEVVVTYTASMLRCGMGVWAIENLLSEVATDTGSDIAITGSELATDIDVTAGGVAFGTVYAASTATHAWVGLTQRYDALIETGNQRSGASSVFAAAQTALAVTATLSTGSGTQPLLLVSAYR